MARLPVRFIADARDGCIATLKSHIPATRKQNMKLLLQHMNKNNDSETAFKYLIQRQKVRNHNPKIYSMVFLEDMLKIQELCANSQSTMAVL